MINNIISEIENKNFLLQVSLASGLKNFIRNISNSDQVKKIITWLINNHQDIDIVVNRLIDLSAQPIDERYKHPEDDLMTIYLYVLFFIRYENYGHVLESAFNAKNTFWTRQFIKTYVYDDKQYHKYFMTNEKKFYYQFFEVIIFSMLLLFSVSNMNKDAAIFTLWGLFVFTLLAQIFPKSNEEKK